MLLQVDGSRHDWLEGRGPWLTLHAAIDDATSEVVWAVFREEEDATGYALLLHHLSQTHGLPLALYADRHTIFQNPKQATLAEQLAGQEPRTYVGRLLDELGIGLIPAYSRQAKGGSNASSRPSRTAWSRPYAAPVPPMRCRRMPSCPPF